jgi:hypothetical protein
VAFKQAYLTAIGFDFNNYAIACFDPATNTFTGPSGQCCIRAEPNSPAQLAGKGLPEPDTPSTTFLAALVKGYFCLSTGMGAKATDPLPIGC